MKRWIAALLLPPLLYTALVSASFAAGTPPDTDTLGAAVLMEPTTGTRLWGARADDESAIAGLSKLPAILTLAQSTDDGTIDPAKQVSVSEHAAAVPGPTAFLEGGETVAAMELMKAAVMISAGDAIMALGESTFGSESVFCENINITLRQLGLSQSVTDAVGTNLRLTAWELAVLGKAASESKTFSQYCALYLDSLTHNDGRETELVNANRLIKSYAGCGGMMTGSSASDGYCGIFYAKRNGTALIAVVLNATDANQRAAAAVALLDYGFAGYRTETIAKAGTPLVEAIPVRNGDRKTIDLMPKETVHVVLESASGKLKKAYEAPAYLEAPLDPEVPVGEMQFLTENGGVISTVPLYPALVVQAFGISDILLKILAVFCE